MHLDELLRYLREDGHVKAGSEALFACDAQTQETLRLTMALNSQYHTPEEVREIMARVIHKPLPPNTFILPPFYTDFGVNITLGQGVYINIGCTIQDFGGVTIGDGCQIGHHVKILTVTHEMDPEHRGDFSVSPVTIGKNVWIGAGATILPGVTIGNGAVIGADAVVTKDVGACCIAAGNPARIIRQIPRI